MAEKYGIELDRNSWRDGYLDQRPVEIKAAMRELASGAPGRFRLFESQHSELKQRGGRYVFAVYRARGSGVQILQSRVLPAREISLDFGPSDHGSPNRDQQRKIDHRKVFQ
jgi:hypothetical protein